MTDLREARRALLAAYDAHQTWPADDPDFLQLLVVDLLDRSAAAPPRAGAERLGVTIWLCICYDDASEWPTWVITDGDLPGTLAWHESGKGESCSNGPDVMGCHTGAASVLLWLRGRMAEPEVDADVGRRLQALVVSD